jgi:hypothetical protein
MGLECNDEAQLHCDSGLDSRHFTADISGNLFLNGRCELSAVHCRNVTGYRVLSVAFAFARASGDSVAG